MTGFLFGFGSPPPLAAHHVPLIYCLCKHERRRRDDEGPRGKCTAARPVYIHDTADALREDDTNTALSH